MKQLIFKHELPLSPQEAWFFFSNPCNLAEITPPSMNFRIRNSLPPAIYEGMIIEYGVSPMWNISMEWITEITHVNAPYYFVDEQRVGPYKIWHHEHHFRESAKGVEMTDILWYSVPFGFLGKWIDFLIVGKKVSEIFAYRKQKLDELFESGKYSRKPRTI
jgi:ligand-binding SRPBCC domain-containing protein